MKKNFKFILITLLFMSCLFIIFKNNIIIKDNIVNTSIIFITKVFPSLFLMFILSSFLINYGMVDFLSYIFQKPFSLIFKINPYTSYIFFMSLISGSPTNAKYTVEILNKGYIKKSDAEKILCFSQFVNPIFMISMTYYIFKDMHIVKSIIISLYLANILVGLVIRNFNKCDKFNYLSFNDTLKNINNNYKHFSKIFNTIIFDSIKTMLLIFATMIIFSTLFKILSITFIHNNTLNIIISGIFELSTGLNNLIYLDSPNILKEVIAITNLSFSGLCILSQIKSIINDYNISFKYFFLSRFLHIILSLIIFFIII